MALITSKTDSLSRASRGWDAGVGPKLYLSPNLIILIANSQGNFHLFFEMLFIVLDVKYYKSMLIHSLDKMELLYVHTTNYFNIKGNTTIEGLLI